MVSLVNLLQSIYDELKKVADSVLGTLTVSGTTYVSDDQQVTEDDTLLDQHVGQFDRTKDLTLPFFGFEWTLTANERGLGGNTELEAIEQYTAEDIDDQNTTVPDTLDVTRGRDYTLTLDLGVVVDGDNPRQAVQYFENLQGHFSSFVDDAGALHSGVTRVREMNANPEDPGSDGDVGVRLTYEVEYTATQTTTVPTAKTVDWDVDADGTDAYPENYN